MPASRRFRSPFREQRVPERWRELEDRFNQHQELGKESVWFESAWRFVTGFAESVFSSNELRRHVGPGLRPQERHEFQDPDVRLSSFGNGPFIH